MAIILLILPMPSLADHPGDMEGHEHEESIEDIQAQIVEYPASFFQRYRPNTALDMVNQIPGFQLDNGMDTRGFATAAGNILINDTRPNVKQDSPSNILDRIPAGNVARIDLIRGQMTGVDMQGQPVVVNIILREASEASVRWEAYVWKNTDVDILMPGGAISLSNRWKDWDYNIGIDGNRHGHATIGSRNSYDADGNLSEDRTEDIINTHLLLNGNINASTRLGETLLQFNTKYRYSQVDETLLADRIPQALGSIPRQEEVVDDRLDKDFELGLTAERPLTENLLGKGIFIFNTGMFAETSAQTVVDNSGTQTLFRFADRGADSNEVISRAEFDWVGINSHTIQFNVEGAYNSLEQNFLQTDDTGTGPVVVDVPGSNTKVEELRGDFVLADTWSLNKIDFNYGLGAEVSQIKQTGDAVLERDFFFVKPHAILIYSPQQSNQTRARLAREVSQLDFNDFISATVFQDNDLALGNPNLQPETTWVADLTHERRFGDIGLFKLRLYYHWISNVEDLLPLTSDFEAPGNIGNGNRRGIEVESTLPMDWLGIKSSRLDFKGRVQDSSVTDPVTGENRQLSSQGRLSAMIPYNDIDLDYIIAVDFRQDFEAQSMAWGWEVRERAERPLFKVNELDIFNEGTELNIFVETTRWLGMKIQFTAKDVFDSQKLRTRTIYTGERGLSAIERNEISDVTRGRQFEILFNGSF